MVERDEEPGCVAGRNGSADADAAGAVLVRSTSTVVALRQPEKSRQMRVIPAIGSVFWPSFAGLVVAWERSKKKPL